MDILFVSANRERNPYPVFPLGLAYLAEPLDAAGHRLQVLDLCFVDNPAEAVNKALAEFGPKAVVVSIRNIDNVTWPGSRSYLQEVREIVGQCRVTAPVILGGSGFSLMPAELLAFLDGDYGVIGEGEEVLPRLIAALACGERRPRLPGVLCRGDKSWSPPVPVARICTPRRDLFAVSRYHREGGMANLQTKRGCPFSCVYCTYPLLEGSSVRLRPIEEVVAEIRHLVDDYGVNYLYFVDDIFNYPPDYAENLCRAMAEARLGVSWSAFINPGFITRSLFETMIQAGCDAVEFGTDSGSSVMLRNLGKSFGVEEVREASRICREAGLDFAHYILLGGPGETPATVAESFALMDEVAPTAVIAMTGIRVFPGTAVYRRALDDGIISPESSLLEPVFYISPQIRDTLCDLVTREATARKNWVVPGMEINMSDAMLEAMRHFSVRGPLWKLVKRLGRSHISPMQGMQP